jgi:SAM-dependent methyltransferase
VDLRLVCPACRRPLAKGSGEWLCASCPRAFPEHHGIPDLRLTADPYLSLEDDRARADRVVAALEGHDLRGLLEHYWRLSAETPLSLRGRFVESALRASPRARDLVHRLRAEALLGPESLVLEIGSGTAPFLTEAAPHTREIVGVDPALRWLHVGRRRLQDGGVAVPPLLAAAGEALPFEAGRFDLVVCLATLEFARDPGRLLEESARVLRPGGTLVLTTVNRFSLLPNPHVGLLGLGFLPKTWQPGYVRARGRGASFALRLLSKRELTQRARAHFDIRRLEPADLPPDLASTGAERLALRVYRTLRLFPPTRWLLSWVGPEWEAQLVKR